MKRKDLSSVPINQKRLLSILEFQAYCGLGRNRALELSKKAKCRVETGNRRILIDRILFDEWCNQNCY